MILFYVNVIFFKINCCIFISIAILSGHLKIDKTKVLMENGSLMEVQIITECSPWNILQYFWLY